MDLNNTSIIDGHNNDETEKSYEKFESECADHLSSIVNRCKHDKYLSSRLLIHLKDILPNALDNEHKTHVENERRKELLEQELHSFQTYFLATNLLYFSPTNSSFYLYDGVNYKHIKEDDIIVSAKVTDGLQFLVQPKGE